MKLIVTGAAGFIGSHTVERLLSDGHAVTGIDNFDPYYDIAIKRKNLEPALGYSTYGFIEGEYGDPALLHRLLPGGRFDAIIHLAAQAGVRPSLVDPQKYARVNVVQLINLLQAMHEYGPKRIVAASSSSVYGNVTPAPFREDAPCLQPQSPYGASKRASEIYLGMWSQLYKIHATVVRPFTVYGPRQRPDMAIASFAKKILRQEPITLYGDGSSSRDYTFVEDIVNGLLGALACDKPFGIYNLGGDHPYTLNEMVAALEQALNKKAIVKRQPMQPGDVDRTCADLTRSRQDLGFDPKVSLAEGLKRTVGWVRAELGM